MDNRLSPPELDKLLPALPLLAKNIGRQVLPERQVLEHILRTVGVQADEWAVTELLRWAEILQKASAASNSDEKAILEGELRYRGIPEAPATLAVDAATLLPLTVEPQGLDFGLLEAGERADRTLRVTGVLLNIEVPSRRLKITRSELSSGDTLVNVILSAGSPGESFRDSIILEGRRDKLGVLVTARWKEEPPRLQRCPLCGEDSLFWNGYDRQFECLNLACRAVGRSVEELAKRYLRGR